MSIQRVFQVSVSNPIHLDNFQWVSFKIWQTKIRNSFTIFPNQVNFFCYVTDNNTVLAPILSKINSNQVAARAWGKREKKLLHSASFT